MYSTDLMQYFYTDKNINSTPINIVLRSHYKEWQLKQEEQVQNWIASSGFKPEPGKHLCIPNTKGGLDSVLVITDQENTIWALGDCAKSLPEGNYHIAAKPENTDEESYLLGWGLGAYRYSQYKNTQNKLSRLFISRPDDKNHLQALLEATALTRDLINTPASDMMPQHLLEYSELLAQQFGAELIDCSGDDLLQKNYPMIHAVGRASVHPPRLIEWNWGNPKHPKVTLIGKGVSFDSGGLDIKSATGMRLMKKDMGGAAHVLGIARAIMHLELPVYLRIFVPTVENAISDNAYRPGDIIKSRSGKTIEIENTDAEGRLILCDAISKAIEEAPDIIIDFATLTGAARVALGTEVPAFFTNDNTLVEEIMQASEQTHDPVWQLPLHKPYRYLLNSDTADISNCATDAFGGAITAALFLNEFVPDTTRWLHFDVMAWNSRNRPGRPKGGEAMGLRTIVEFIRQRYEA